MKMYHKRIESLSELHEVIVALETLGKEYKIVKRIEWTEPKPPLPKLPRKVWIVNECDGVITVSDGKELENCYDCEWCHKGKATHNIRDNRYGEDRKICMYCYTSIAQSILSNNAADELRKNI
ncbi:hypothetical protein [Bacillus cereus group sp. BfR-BA-01489]|uniref:hypothetical protein n=1 Tax=Bacillus cereus group sp. BfR-BA-01489 TaxID=2920358 RepID=UPI001F566A94